MILICLSIRTAIRPHFNFFRSLSTTSSLNRQSYSPCVLGNTRQYNETRHYSNSIKCADWNPVDGNSHTKATPNLSVSLFKNPIVHKLWSARQEAKAKSLLNKVAVQKDPDVLTLEKSPKGKHPSDARVEVCYPFATDALLWESYRNPWGSMRFGKMLEDLDALAGNIAFFHVDNDDVERDVHPVIVTASVDKISLRQRPKEGTNQVLSGQVTWTGRSSMEIRMKCIEEGAEQEWVDALFTFVTLDPVTKKPVHIPPLIPSNESEQLDFELGAARAEIKKKRRKQQQSTFGSDSDEVRQLAQKLLSQAGPLLSMPSLADPYSILMQNTKMQNAEIAQPQAQNLHNRIFGGFLMRRAFELAFSNAYLFGGARPIFVEVDEISFTSPVDVGDLLVFNSCVLYTEDEACMKDYFGDTNDVKLPLLHIEVEAWITEPEKVTSKLSNLFSFTFAVSNNNKPIRKVVPANIDEANRMAHRMYADELQKKNENESLDNKARYKDKK